MNCHKELERFYLARFMKLCPDFPHGEIVPSERPDFLVGGSEGVVGIELMRVYQPEPVQKKFPIQAVEKKRDEIVKRIKNYFPTGWTPLRVLVSFRANVTDYKNIQNEVLKSVAALIGKYKPENGETVCLPDCLESKEDFPSWLDEICINTLAPEELDCWTATKFSKIRKIFPSNIQKEIESKDQKCSLYREKCDWVWLVLMTNVGDTLGTRVKLLANVWNHWYETLFDQVWIFQNPDLARKLEIVRHNSNQDTL